MKESYPTMALANLPPNAINGAELARELGVTRGCIARWMRNKKGLPYITLSDKGGKLYHYHFFDLAKVKAWLPTLTKAEENVTTGRTITGETKPRDWIFQIEAAKLFGVSREAPRLWILQGAPSVTINGTPCLKLQGLLSWLAEKQLGPFLPKARQTATASDIANIIGVSLSTIGYWKDHGTTPLPEKRKAVPIMEVGAWFKKNIRILPRFNKKVGRKKKTTTPQPSPCVIPKGQP